jgi:hypothetical protein
MKRKGYALAVLALTPFAALGFALIGGGAAVLGMLKAAVDLWSGHEAN